MKTEPTHNIKNIKDLRLLLVDTYKKLVNDEIPITEAKAISKLTDQIIKSKVAMIAEAKRLNKKGPIEFFE